MGLHVNSMLLTGRGRSPVLLLLSHMPLSCAACTHARAKAVRWKKQSEPRFVEKNAVKGLSRSKLAEIIKQRFDKYEYENLIRVDKHGNSIKCELPSLSAEKYLSSNIVDYPCISAQRALAEKAQSESNCETQANVLEGQAFPLEGVRLQVRRGAYLKNTDDNIMNADRGFFVHGNHFYDDYIVGSSQEIPGGTSFERDEDMFLHFGNEDAVEEIDFQLPGQNTSVKAKNNQAKEFDDELLVTQGTIDPEMPVSDKKCGGCGASFHCKDSSLPGFVPRETFVKLRHRQTQLCRRCLLLERHNFLLNVNVCEVDYRAMMEHLKMRHEALIVLIVDVTSLPTSVFSDLPNIIGYRKPMIVIGNKVDLLPPDARPGFLRHFKRTLQKTISSVGFVDSFNIIHTALISARTGYGVEDLITNIFLKFSAHDAIRSDIYLVGCTNVGKSTLFNALLQSDLCKVRALDLVQRATTTPWPGTTISLLKFPVMNPSPYKLEIRRRRLLAARAWEYKEQRLRHLLHKETSDSKYITLQAFVGNSFKELEEELQPRSFQSILEGKVDGSEKKWDPDLQVFSKGKWCYDTPGTVNSEQVLDMFTLNELIDVLPRKMILPRTFIMHEGESLVIGGVARVDVLSLSLSKRKWSGTEFPGRRSSILLTLFASDRIPVMVKKSTEMTSFYEKYLGSPVLVVPAGNHERLEKFPKLEGREVTLTSVGFSEGTGDVVLSSLGWVCVTSAPGTICLMAYTPGARGISLREPPMLPHCAQLKGARIPGTNAYKVKPPEMPKLSKKKRSRKNSKLRRNL